MTKTQYRLTYNGGTQHIHDTYPEFEWMQIAVRCESRGLNATLERRHVFDDEDGTFMAGLVNPEGYIKTGMNVVICPWEIIAEIKCDERGV